MNGSEYVQNFDQEPQFWQFLRGLHSDDLIVELIQNDLDASASCTSITFGPDRLICKGDGQPVSEDGWRRLCFVMGAGVKVANKRHQIGVKNHGLKACFSLGDEIIVRSDGRRVVQTLYKDGFDNRPSPATYREPVSDSSAPPVGCSIEVPYREQELKITTGEGQTVNVPSNSFIESLFKSACELLPSKLLGVVRPGIRDQYTVHLSHHALGSLKIHWRAKKGRRIRPGGRREFTVFSRECNVVSETACVPSTTIHERAAMFRLPFPTGQRREVPDFFSRDRNSSWAEIAWRTDKRGTPRPSRGVRRYPIGYSDASKAGCSRVGVHFSGPYISDAERHGASHMDSLNAFIDDACKDALVDIVCGHLVHQYGGKAMELYIASPGDVDDDALEDLVERTIDKRALPVASTVSKSSKRSRRFSSGPRKTPDGTLRRIVLPMFTWDYTRISPHLSKICPKGEDQIDKTVPGPILSRLADRDEFLITFDQNDVISRLQPEQDAEYFPWEDGLEWQTALGDSSVAKVYLDVVYETIQQGKLDSESEVRDNTYLADHGSRAVPLAKMFSALNLPPNLRQQAQVSLLHPALQDHRLFKRKGWKPKPYRLEDFLDRAHLETASHEDRASFWNWLRDNWRTVKPRKVLNRIADLPIWPSTNGDLLPLHNLCAPSSARVTAIIGDAIRRPSRELLKIGIATGTGRGRLTIRNTPSLRELESYLANQIDRFPREQKLTADERHEFHKLEKQLAILVASVPRLREYLVELGGTYGIALDMAGSLRLPGELVRAKGALQRLCLLNEYLIDRPNSILDRIDGWKPRTAPSTSQIVNTFRRDGTRLDVHVPRLQEYVKQSRREGEDFDSLLDVRCIPVDGELRAPSEIALPGTPDFWGDWKLRVPVAAVNPETQSLYKLVGVTGSTPDPTNSRQFFQWLARQDTAIMFKHAEQALRHINHRSGPRTWSAEFPQVPFIMVSYDRDRVRLVTQADATARRSKVVIPDFEELEEAIRQDQAESSVEIAIVEHARVTKPVTAYLRELGLRTLSDYAGDPIRVVGNGQTVLPLPNHGFKEILKSLDSGSKGRELHKRLASLDLDTAESALRGNWRERLRTIQDIGTADSVVATYRLGRRRLSVPVDGKLDKDSGILWLSASADPRKVFFDAIAQHVFATPKKYHGVVLDAAYRQVVTQRHPEEYTDVDHHQENIDIDETVNHREADAALVETSARHSATQRDRSRNVPRPGPIPQGIGAARNVSAARKASARRASNRAISADENAQIADLKENQYAWHCQACLAETDPKTLAPKSSYVEHADGRRQLMQAHHPDHVNAGGARHVGNILLLCQYHHDELGDAVTRTEITRSLDQATARSLTFNSDNGVSNSIQGKLVNIRSPQRQHPVSLFFTREHADYWLSKATEEVLL